MGRPYGPAPAVYELSWIALGVAVALVATQVWRVVCAPTNPTAADAEQSNGAEATAIQTNVAPESHELAISMAEELASLVSALEARTHHLIEAAPSRTQLPGAAEALLASVDRLRHLHKKLIAFGKARPVEAGTADVTELITGISDELQLLQLGLELRWEPPPELPRIDANADAMRDAMLFVCAALLRAERGATRLTFSVERSFSHERPTMKIELNLEWIAAPGPKTTRAVDGEAFALDWEAAKHLVHSHAGELTMSHLPGKAVQAVVRLPIVLSPEHPGNAAPQPADLRPNPPSAAAGHDYGGALVLESDPALRAVLARELKASGRAVFACADGESAHTFLQATPDRFELLIVDDGQHLDERSALARTIRAHAPSLKICLLTTTTSPTLTGWPDLYTLQKPFGVHELRRTLASILTPH